MRKAGKPRSAAITTPPAANPPPLSLENVEGAWGPESTIEQEAPEPPISYPSTYQHPAITPTPAFSFAMAETEAYPAFMWGSPLRKFHCTECGVPFFIGGPLCPLHNREVNGVEIRRSGRHGLGVFAARDLPAGTVLASGYHGVLFDKGDVDKRYPDSCAPYGLDIGDHWSLDSATVRCLASLINCVNPQETPNILFKEELVGVEQKLAGVVEILRDLEANDELLADYGSAYTTQEQAGCIHSTTVGHLPIHEAPEFWEIRIAEVEELTGQEEGKGKGKRLAPEDSGPARLDKRQKAD